METYDVYYAAPFFSNAEREMNSLAITSLERFGFTVFSPSRDGIVAKNEIVRNGSWDEVAARVWVCDTEAIISSRAVLAVLDGRSIDEGVCVEIGFASAHNKPIVALNSDDRRQFPWGHNPMITYPVHIFVCSLDAAVYELNKILRCE